MEKRTPECWIDRLKRLNALWIHDHNVHRPHIEINGYHSCGYFSDEIMENSELLDEAAADIALLLYCKYMSLFNTINRAVGPAYGAITFAHDVARNISRIRKNFTCLDSYGVKKNDKGMESIVFEKCRIVPGEKILLCDNIIWTGEGVRLTMKAVLEQDGVILPCIVTFLNLSGLEEICGKKIIALINYPMPKWQTDECPLCKVGSKAIPPTVQNWTRLNAVF